MKILLMGEAGSLHWTLAEALRRLGHEVCVASDGDGWKNYPRDIDLSRPTDSPIDGLRCLGKVLRHLPSFRGYDVVQLINPYFLRLRCERSLPIYRYLKRHNGRVFLGAFGNDHFYTRACLLRRIYRYSDYKTGNLFRNTETNRREMEEKLYGGTAKANREIAATCDGIIACLWEYYAAYRLYHPEKLTFIPLPIDLEAVGSSRVRSTPRVVNFFIGIQSRRSDVKGTDIMLPVLREVQRKYPDRCRITEAVDVPYARYCHLLEEADVQLDQLYSYTPSMNSLLAMAKGIVVVGGGEPENYDILGERELRPIVNVLPDEADIYRRLEELALHPERIPELSRQSIEYVSKYHNSIDVARQYLAYWTK